MKRLSRAETQSLLTALSILHLNHDDTPVTSRIFRAVREVAAADIYGLNTFHPQGYWLEQTWQELSNGVNALTNQKENNS